MIRMKKIRDSAKGQDCTINSPWCNYNPETVVLAHYACPGESGMGIKNDDTSAAYACSMCHDWLDGRYKPKTVVEQSGVDKEWHWFRGIRRTTRLLVINGVLK